MEPEKLIADTHSETVVKDAIVDNNYKLKESEQATVDAYDYFKSLDLKLSEEDEKRIGGEITLLAGKYEDNNKDYYAECKELRTWYEDELEEKLFPWPGCAQHNEPVIQRDVDTYISRIKRVIFGRRPYFIFSSLNPAKNEDTRRKENYIDYIMNIEMKIKEYLGFVLHDAVLLGTGACSVDWLKEINRVKDIEVYNGQKDIQKFLTNYPDAQKKYPEFVNKLMANEKLELIVDYDDVTYNAPKLEHIELEDLVINNCVRDLKKQVLLGKQKKYTKDELLEKEDEGFFENIDKVVGDLKKKDTDYIYNKATNVPDDKEYTVYEVMYKYKKTGDKLSKKGLFWVEKDTGTILKSIAYPYWHNRPTIVLFYIEDHGTKAFRRGIGYRQWGANDSVNTTIRQGIDNNTLCNQPIISIKPDSDFDPGFEGLYPGVRIPYGADLKQIEIRTNARDCLEIANYIKRSAEGRTGVTNYMTGGESPTDPNSPMGKTQVLLGESNLRLAAPIECIQRGFTEVCTLITEEEYQFIEEGKEFRVLGESSSGKNAFDTITRDELKISGDYVSQGSLDNINPDISFQKNQFMYMTLSKDPSISGNPAAMYELLRALVLSASEYWEKNVDKIVPSPEKALEQIAEHQKRITEKTQEIKLKQYFEKLVMQGIDPEEALIMARAMAFKESAEPDREAYGMEPEPDPAPPQTSLPPSLPPQQGVQPNASLGSGQKVLGPNSAI